jgi:hypothetical protein
VSERNASILSHTRMPKCPSTHSHRPKPSRGSTSIRLARWFTNRLACWTLSSGNARRARKRSIVSMLHGAASVLVRLLRSYWKTTKASLEAATPWAQPSLIPSARRASTNQRRNRLILIERARGRGGN